MGRINKKGEAQFSQKFNYLGSLYDNLAVAQLDSLFGYVNDKGEWLIEPIYDYAKDFSSGFAWVNKNGKNYVINTCGETLFEHHCDDIPCYHGNFLIVYLV